MGICLPQVYDGGLPFLTLAISHVVLHLSLRMVVVV